jgi:hypothetical protein
MQAYCGWKQREDLLLRAFTTHALDALGHPDPKPVPAHSEEFGNAR